MKESDIDRVIQMAWEDRTPFEAIDQQFQLKERHVRSIMRKHLKASSFKLWRKRVSGRRTKHLALRTYTVGRFRSKTQRNRS